MQSERRVSSILITILRFWQSFWKDRTFSFPARREGHFQKDIVKNGLSNFVKLGSEILKIYFWQKNGRLFVCCNTSSDFGLLFLNFSSRWAENGAIMYLNSTMDCFKLWGFLDSNFETYGTYGWDTVTHGETPNHKLL